MTSLKDTILNLHQEEAEVKVSKVEVIDKFKYNPHKKDYRSINSFIIYVQELKRLLINYQMRM